MICKVRQTLVLLIAAAFVLVGCGGGGDADGSGDAFQRFVLSGTAAAGKPVVGGAVSIVGANGRLAFDTTDANGKFVALVRDLTFPVLVKVVRGEVTLFGWTDRPGNVNVTPLTTAALVLSPDLPDNLNDVFANWRNQSGNMTKSELREQQEIINANLAQALINVGLNPLTYDFLTTRFNANGSGIDSLLDLYNFTFDFTRANGFAEVVNITRKSGDVNVPVDFDLVIDTSDICIGCDADDTDAPTVCISSGAAVYTFDLGPTCPDPMLFGFLGAGSPTDGFGGQSVLAPSAAAPTVPPDSHGRIAKVVRSAQAAQFAGTVIIVQPPLQLPFTASAKWMSVRVWSPAAGIKVQLKVDNGIDIGQQGAVFFIAEKFTTSPGWQLLWFNFNEPVFSSSDPVNSPLDPNQVYDRVTISFNIGVTGAGEQTFYFDEISFPRSAPTP